MDRPQFLKDLADSLDGVATAEQSEALAQAMNSDAGLRQSAAELYVQESLLEELLEPAPALFSSAQIMERAARQPAPGSASGNALHKNEERTPLRTPAVALRPGKARRFGRGAKNGARSSGLPLWASLAAGFAILVVLAIVGERIFRKPEKPTEPEVAKEAPVKKEEPKKEVPVAPKIEDPIQAIAGGIYKREGNLLTTDHRSTIDVKLSDGSVVTCQPNTSVSFAKPTAEVRQELEMKEGRVQVVAAKDPRAFRIRTGKEGVVTVVGTTFSIRLPEAKSMHAGAAVPAWVSVDEGSVRVKNTKGELTLEPKGQAVLCDAFEPVRILRDDELHGFRGRVRGQVLIKGDARLLIRIQEAAPGKENQLERVRELSEKVVWLYLPEEKGEDGRERLRNFMREVQCMASVSLNLLWGKGHAVFGLAD